MQVYGEDQNLNDFLNSCWIDIGEREENWREDNQKQAESLVGWLGGRLTCNQFAPWALSVDRSVDRPTLYCLTESWRCQSVDRTVDRPNLWDVTESWGCQTIDRAVNRPNLWELTESWGHSRSTARSTGESVQAANRKPTYSVFCLSLLYK